MNFRVTGTGIVQSKYKNEYATLIKILKDNNMGNYGKE